MLKLRELKIFVKFIIYLVILHISVVNAWILHNGIYFVIAITVNQLEG